MTYSTNNKQCRYLLFDLDNVHKIYLKYIDKMGLKEFINAESLIDFIANKIFFPVLRVDIPKEYFEAWKNYPIKPADCGEMEDKLASSGLFDIYFKPDFQDKKWFLHPYDSEDPDVKQFLSYQVDPAAPYPEPYVHERAGDTHLSKLFFPYWSIYFLWDLLPYIYPTSLMVKSYNIEKDIQNITRNCRFNISINNSFIESVQSKWYGYKEVFDCISYYKTLQGLFFTTKSDILDFSILEQGIKDLTAYLHITEDKLFSYLKLELELFHDWKRRRRRGVFPIAEESIRSLQKDIYFTVEWLRSISSITWQDIIDKIKVDFTNVARIEDALPFETFLSIQHFKKYKQYYLEDFNSTLPGAIRIDCNKFNDQIDKNFDNTISFQYVIRAYQRVHKCLRSKYEIEFSSKDIIDYLIVCYTRVEAYLKEIIPQADRTLKLVIKQFKQHSQINELSIAFEFAINNWDNYAIFDLKTNSNPFISTNKLTSKKNPRDVLTYSDFLEELGFRIVRFALVRNMFAHTSAFDEHIYENRGELFKDVNVVLSYIPGVVQDIFVQ